jgi:hypothetical protein
MELAINDYSGSACFGATLCTLQMSQLLASGHKCNAGSGLGFHEAVSKILNWFQEDGDTYG